LNTNGLFGSAKREGKDQAESLGLTMIEHHRKNTEDEPRGVVFKHDLIEGNDLRIGSLMGHLKDSERIRLKGCTIKIRLGPTTMKIKIEIFSITYF
jgi:hypothetical protein